MAYVADVHPLLLAQLLVDEELALYLDAVLQSRVVHAAGTVEGPAVPPLALEVVLGMVRAHGVDDRAGGGAYEAALLVLRAVQVVGGHGPCHELVGDWV